MKDKTVAFALCYVNKYQTVQFSPEGHDVLHALLVRWLSQCHTAMLSARAMERESQNPLLRGQADYWANCCSFIKGKLLNNLNHKFNCSEELKILSKHYESGQLPEGWAEIPLPDTTWVQADGSHDTPAGGGGSDRTGDNSHPEAELRRERPNDPVQPDGSAPVENPPKRRKQTGKNVVSKRAKGTKLDRKRGR